MKKFGFVMLLLLLLFFGMPLYLAYRDREHDSVSLNQEEFKDYLVKNHDELKADESKIAKKICLQLDARISKLEESKKESSEKLKSFQELQENQKQRQEKIEDLTEKVRKTKSFFADAGRVNSELKLLVSRQGRLQKDMDSWNAELEVMRKVEIKDDTKINSIISKIKNNEVEMRKLSGEICVLRENQNLLNDLERLKTLESEQPIRQKQIMELQAEMETSNVRIQDFQARIAMLERVFDISLGKEKSREYWRSIFYGIAFFAVFGILMLLAFSLLIGV